MIKLSDSLIGYWTLDKDDDEYVVCYHFNTTYDELSLTYRCLDCGMRINRDPPKKKKNQVTIESYPREQKN